MINLQDLLALLKNVENEITLCESNLKDEIEKRKKYKVTYHLYYSFTINKKKRIEKDICHLP